MFPTAKVIFSQSNVFSFFFYNISDECFVSKLCVISNSFFLSFLYILQEFYPTDNQLGYIMDLLYNAFFCFEMTSLNAVLMMSCVVYAGSALKCAWEMAMKRIVVPMPRYTYVLLMSFSNYKILLLRLIHSKTSQTQAQISHNCCFYISLSLILIMISVQRKWCPIARG